MPAVHFDTYQILQQHCAFSLPQHAFLVGLCLQTAVKVNNYLLKSDKCDGFSSLTELLTYLS